MMEHFFLSRKWQHRIIQHLLFWVVHILTFSFLYSEDFLSAFKYVLEGLPFKLVLVYILIYPLFNRYLANKKYILFGLLGIGLLWLVSLGQYGASYLIWPEEMAKEGLNFRYLFVSLVMNSYVAALGLAIKLTKYWSYREKYIQELKNSRLEAELKFLKAQIHPHFLFNTMNNLYTLALKKSDRAPEVIDKLSELLRYMAYEANTERVPLVRELRCVNNYIHLEKLRYGSNLEIACSVKGPLEDLQIAPLLLIPFVENSFKHGISGGLEKGWLTMDLFMEEQMMTFKIENSIAPATRDETGYREGIGLSNVKRRLELIYPNHYSLKITAADTYLVILKLELS